MMHLLNDDTRALLQRNDPSVEELRVDWHDFIDNYRESDGLLIGQCTTIKRLKLTGLVDAGLARCLPDETLGDEYTAKFEAVLRGISNNRSIEELLVDGYGPEPLTLPDGSYFRSPDTFSILLPLFEHNHNFRRLHLAFNSRPPAHMFPEGHAQLVSALGACSSLRELQIKCSPQDGDEFGGEIFAALKNGRSNLTELSLRGCYSRWNGCAELGELIKHSHSLKELDLRENNIDDRGAEILGRALGNTRLMTLLFRPMMQDEFREVFEGSITLAGWRDLFACLKSPDCALEELAIEGCDNDEKALALADGLVGNTSLTTLTLTSCLSPEGWCSFFSRLFGPRPSPPFELLDFLACEIDRDDFGAEIDPGIARRLANALESSVKTLVFNEESLSTAMASNHAAKWLLLGELVRDEGEMRHALGTQLDDLRGGSQNFDMGVISSWLSDDLVALLDMNAANDDKTKVVCEKVRLYYNTCNPTVEDDELLLRELRNDSADLQWNKVMPFAMAWAGGGDNPTLLYRIIRRVPTLFGSDGGMSATGKRKATS